MRSLTIQASFNFCRMQNLGFAFALLPLIRRERDPRRLAESLDETSADVQYPSLSGRAGHRLPWRGSRKRAIPEAADHLKKALMGPYAAIGDPFFWGALRPFSAVGAVILALKGVLLAPLAFLLLYNPAHLWVRGKGFIEGYRRGKGRYRFHPGTEPAGGSREDTLSVAHSDRYPGGRGR